MDDDSTVCHRFWRSFLLMIWTITCENHVSPFLKSPFSFVAIDIPSLATELLALLFLLAATGESHHPDLKRSGEGENSLKRSQAYLFPSGEKKKKELTSGMLNLCNCRYLEQRLTVTQQMFIMPLCSCCSGLRGDRERKPRPLTSCSFYPREELGSGQVDRSITMN